QATQSGPPVQDRGSLTAPSSSPPTYPSASTASRSGWTMPVSARRRSCRVMPACSGGCDRDRSTPATDRCLCCSISSGILSAQPGARGHASEFRDEGLDGLLRRFQFGVDRTLNAGSDRVCGVRGGIVDRFSTPDAHVFVPL